MTPLNCGIQYRRRVIALRRRQGGLILNISGATRLTGAIMTRVALTFVLLLATASLAQAACYADYKAKQDDPLRLQYGVAEIFGACTPDQAHAELAPRLAAAGWQLLEVQGVFDDSGLEGRRASAGEFFLRF